MTKDEYQDYKELVQSFFDREQINCLNSTGKSNEFSSYPCECCGRSLAGYREEATGYHEGAKEVFTYSICLDCIYYAEYGQLDDQTMFEIEGSDS